MGEPAYFTERMGLPVFDDSIGEAETWSNMGLRRLDALLPPVYVLDVVNAPTGSEVSGDVYIVGSAPSGLFSGFVADDIAYYDGTTWWNRAPDEGWWVRNKNGGTPDRIERFNGTAWVAW